MTTSQHRISFPGEHGAYSEAAALSFFGSGAQTVPFATFAEVLESTIDGTTGSSVLPVENILEGSVGQSYDLLYTTPLDATGEIYHRIEHCLIGTAGSVDDVDTAYSHPQALGQCRRFLEEHGIKEIPTYDTAGSVKIVKDLGKANCACIASREAAAIHGMPVIAEDIANNPDNYTRFLVLSKDDSPETGNDKTSIIFSIRHEPGSLYRIITDFHDSGINLTKIESRPAKTNTWEYNFFVDFEGHKDNPRISAMLDRIMGDTIFMNVLGSYATAGANIASAAVSDVQSDT